MTVDGVSVVVVNIFVEVCDRDGIDVSVCVVLFTDVGTEMAFI